MVGQRTLDPLIGVRIPAPQPIYFNIMCGRFIFFEVDKIEDRFDIVLDKSLNFKPNFNIAPSEETLVIINDNSKKE